MLRNFSDSNDLLQETQHIFGEFINPTQISQAQFYKLFKPKSAIGEGVYGTIKCVENCYSQLFAIKESKDSADTYGLYREYSVMKKFNHPNLLKEIAFFQFKENHKLIILTEFCPFKSLKNYSSYLPSLSLHQKIRLCVQIFNGIFALHQQNIMHRDLKPQNVLIDANKRAKICDFGFCTYDDSIDLMKTQRVGTPLYNSPETNSGNNGKNLFRSNEFSKDLETQRGKYFKNIQKYLEDFEIPDTIKNLLENTITEKESKRYSTQQVKDCFSRVVSQNSIKGIKIGEIKEKQGSMLFLEECDEKVDVKYGSLSDRQKLAVNLILRSDSHSNAMKDLQKISKLFKALPEISKSMRDFKTSIEKINVKTTEKYILSYACNFLLLVHLHNLFQQGINIIENCAVDEKPQMKASMNHFLKTILTNKYCLTQNLMKSVNYLQKNQDLIQPNDLFSTFVKNSFEQSKKIQKIFDEGLSLETEMEKFQVQKGIESNRLFFKAILQCCKPNVDRSIFKVQIDQTLKRFRNEKCNLSAESQTVLADQMWEKIKKIPYLKI